MFFIFSKILSFLLAPLFWILLIFLWAIFTKSQVKRKRLLISGFILAFILSNSFLADEVARKWEGSRTENHKIKGSYDVGIVLGGFASYDTLSNTLKLNESGDRIWQALYLYKTGKVKKLLISGGSGSILHRKVTEGDRVFNYLVEIDIPKSDLMMEAISRNTRENAVQSAVIINSEMPDAKCLLITSAFHMKRSMGCFNKVHLDVTPYKTDFLAEPRVWDPDKLLVPSTEALDNWTKLIREIVGYYTYKLAGYI
jgi:uncharacterized SAM-binding protein YcdF (DUF218 family)